MTDPATFDPRDATEDAEADLFRTALDVTLAHIEASPKDRDLSPYDRRRLAMGYGAMHLVVEGLDLLDTSPELQLAGVSVVDVEISAIDAVARGLGNALKAYVPPERRAEALAAIVTTLGAAAEIPEHIAACDARAAAARSSRSTH